MSTETVQRPLGRHLMGGAFDLTGATTAAEAQRAAGLAWEPEHRTLYVAHASDPLPVPVAKERGVVRNDNETMLGVVGREHKIFSNADFFDFADAILAEAGTDWVAAKPVGGALSNGRQPFLCLQLGESIMVAGQDAVNTALLLSNGHVGNGSIVGVVDPLRVGCGNVVRASLRSLGQARFSVQHSGNLAEKMAEARKGLAITSAYMAEFATMADRMAAVDFGLSEFDDFLAELLPISEEAGERAKVTNAAQRGAFRLNWLNTGTLTDDLKRTTWGALNVITEVLDHGDLDIRKSKVPAPERRMNSVQFGAGARLRDRAYGILAGV